MLIAAGAFGAASYDVIPLPQKIEPREGAFWLKPTTKILVESKAAPSATASAEYLAGQLRKIVRYPFAVVSGTNQDEKDAIIFRCTPVGADPKAEDYELSVSPDSVIVHAAGSAGLFYGAQTLLQLLAPESRGSDSSRWSIPAVRIEDHPRFAWRGFLLDVGRHFFSKSEIKQLLDLMAMHKLNTFHWHLTDDQGWRLEIKKYPRLAEVGAWRKSIGFGLDPKSSTAYGPDGRYGGYYTQEDIRELVAYAQSRHITIVPEIEMPGHAGAALAAYPQLSCFGGAYTTDKCPLPGVFCAGKDETYEFLQNVLVEVCELFPGKYIHIGGDEVSPENWKKCPRCQAREAKENLKDEHQLESYFIRRIERFLNEHGRTLVGWSEIREGGLAQNATIMDWIGGALDSARQGHDVVMTPTEYCYLDYYQSTNTLSAEPKAIGGYLPLKQVYAFEPVPAGLEPQFQSHIIGAQGNLWTEYIASLPHAQYMALPRLCALAEVTWSPKQSRNWDDFIRRLGTQARRFDRMGVKYRRASLEEVQSVSGSR
ncbi:MAG TPA: beta-N-acetylhexosaminidase [Patescibacteria group bacterium]|nr:beta-N-acetylhexosaminidase [Patescibacteria group bacterium]